MPRVSLVAAILLLWLIAAAAPAKGAWTPSAFPNPKRDLDKCGRGVPSNICDADRILSAAAANRIEGVIKEIWEGADPYTRAPCGSTGLKGFMVAVALMRNMQVPAGRTAAEQAEVFAKALHDSWQVGDAACNNGVLFLLALEQRQVYISTGAGAKDALPDSQIQNIIAAMRPLLRKERYDEAVEQAVVDIGLGLAGRRDGGVGEAGTDWFAVCFFGVVAALIGNSFRRSWLRRREYRDCKRMLAKLKREQDQVRNHAWSAPPSCPICLEDFNPPPTPRRPVGGAAEDGGAGEAGPSGSGLAALLEDSPSTSLLIGTHGNSGANGGSGGEGEAGASDAESCSRGGGRGGGMRQRRSVGKGLGADGERGGGGAGGPRRPPVTLGCGHTFCDPCLTKWLEQKTTCPICRAKIAGGPGGSAATSPTHPSAASNPGAAGGQAGNEAGSAQAAANRGLWADFWDMELAFRLSNLHRRYPAYVTPALADQWAAEARTTGTFNWEASRDFQLRDPGMRAQHESSGGGGFSQSFGGGSSYGGGGGGGSW